MKDAVKDEKDLNKLKEFVIKKHTIFDQDRLLGGKASQLLAESLTAGPADRFKVMDEFKNASKSLPAKKKELANNLYDAFIDATGTDGVPHRLSNYLERKNPNLNKMIASNRIDRVYETIDMINNRLEVKSVSGGQYVPIFTTMMMMTFGYHDIKAEFEYTAKTKVKNYRGCLLAALLASYARNLNPYDYANMWFVVSFIKNMSVCSMIQPKQLEQYPEFGRNADNIFTLIDDIVKANPTETDK